MLRNVSLCLTALLVASPALAQSVTISESAPITQALSPSLGGTESLAIVTPGMADALTEMPVVAAPPASGDVMPSLGDTESLALITPSQADLLTVDLLAEQSAPTAQPMIVPANSITQQAVQAPAIQAPAELMPAAPAPAAPVQQFAVDGVDPSLLTDSDLEYLPRITAAQASTYIADELAADAPAAEEDVSLYVVTDGMVLPSSNWSASDSAACKQSGGVELNLPGGRIACFKL